MPHSREVVWRNSFEDIHRDHKVPRDRMHIVPVGVDPELFKPIASVTRRTGHLITTESADVAMKGLSYLLEALAIGAPGAQDHQAQVRLLQRSLVLDQAHVADLLQCRQRNIAAGRRQRQPVLLEVDVDHHKLLRQHIQLLHVAQRRALLPGDHLRRALVASVGLTARAAGMQAMEAQMHAAQHPALLCQLSAPAC